MAIGYLLRKNPLLSLMFPNNSLNPLHPRLWRWPDPCVFTSSALSVFYRNPSAFICVHLRLIFVSLRDRARKIQFELFPIINDDLNIQHLSEVYQGNELIKSPQSKQRSQSSAISANKHETASSSRRGTRITRIARISTDTRPSL
jgi:hypothetical protein